MKKRITEGDYLKANRRASRKEEIEAHGHPLEFRRVHRSKRAYDRKKIKAGLKKSLPLLFLSVFGNYAGRLSTARCLSM